jgi:CubicO group peptidase (beta-lactamase class C family)
MWWIVMLVGLTAATASCHGMPLPVVRPETVGMSSERLRQVDGLIQQAIANQDIPGAVLLVARKDKVVWRKAYGNSQLVPTVEPMREDAIFDLASITKPVATASAVMLLVERGQIRLNDPVRLYIPEFTRYVGPSNKPSEDARIYHLLTHTSGLPPYTNADTAAAVLGRPCDPEQLALYIARLPKIAPPGKEFHYSCLGFITLAAIVKRVTGEPFERFVRENLFEPLGMRDTGFLPPKEKLDRVVPTEVIEGKPLRGVVHDPLARLQGGVSGNAGLFSTADDLLRFSLMLLHEGELDGVRIFSPLTVRTMTSVYPEVAFAGRGLGWDVASDYSSNGGELFPSSGFGHTGYTGTSLWIDRETQTVVILLANRVHPVDDGSVVRLRSQIANVVAGAIIEP